MNTLATPRSNFAERWHAHAALTAPSRAYADYDARIRTGPSEDELEAIVLRRCQLAQTALGRCHLRAHVSQQRLLWHLRLFGGPALKRAFDIAASLILLICFAPVFLAIGILVKLQDGGPVFFAQTRVGKNGREFKMYKVRSMCLNAEARLKELLAQNQHSEGVTFKIKNDPRITPLGKWLRHFSLDELPQLVNVLKGDMSLVGPRPPVPREVALYTVAHRRRLAAKPGVTCYWQVGGRSEIDFSGQVQLDVRYIEQQSFTEDIKLLFKTVPAVVCAKGAC